MIKLFAIVYEYGILQSPTLIGCVRGEDTSDELVE